MPVRQLLKDKDKKFRLLFEGNPQPMWVFEAATQRFLEVNAASSALYGYTQEEFRGMTLSDLQPSDEALRFIEELQGPARATPSCWHHRTKNGRAIEVEIAVHEIDYRGRK